MARARELTRAVAGTVGIGLCLAVPASASFPGDAGLIAFQNDTSGGIYTVEPDGSDRTKLDNDGYEPSWSPNGKRIVFVQDAPGTSHTDIYTMKANGSGKDRVAPIKGSEWEPAFSPDGKRIVYRKGKFRGSSGKLYSVNANGKGRKFLRKGERPDWSVPQQGASGGLIAFSWFTDPGPCPLSTHTFSMKPNGGDLELFINFGCDTASGPSWHPDAEVVAASFYAVGSDTYDIFSHDENGITRLTDLAGHDEGAAYSPDGGQVVFDNEGNPGGLWIVSTPLNETAIPNTAGVDAALPSWQPLP